MRRAFAALSLLLLLPACGKEPSRPDSALLKEKDRQYVRETLAAMRDDVRVVLFSRDGGECRFCGDAEALLGGIAAEAPRVKLEVLSLRKDAARAAELGIERVPGIAVLGRKDFGLRYFGLPSGYDFIPFVETLRSAANADPELEPATVAGLAKLAKPVQLTVFVTQHWPYCPKAARVAYGMAVASDLVRAEVIDGDEFPDLARKYNVSGVPKTLVNYQSEFLGAAPEAYVLEKVLAQ